MLSGINMNKLIKIIESIVLAIILFLMFLVIMALLVIVLMPFVVIGVVGIFILCHLFWKWIIIIGAAIIIGSCAKSIYDVLK